MFFLRNFAYGPPSLSVDTKNSFAYNEYQKISRFSAEGCIARGMTNKMIGRELKISDGTVKGHAGEDSASSEDEKRSGVICVNVSLYKGAVCRVRRRNL